MPSQGYQHRSALSHHEYINSVKAERGCDVCSYKRCLAALHFHHCDPEDKKFVVSAQNACRSLASIKAEIAKCDLLCGNCHAERHYPDHLL